LKKRLESLEQANPQVKPEWQEHAEKIEALLRKAEPIFRRGVDAAALDYVTRRYVEESHGYLKTNGKTGGETAE
jgi:hypothetical protein